MNTTTWILAALAAVLLVLAFRQDRDLPLAGLLAAGRTLWRNLLLLLLGFAVAGLEIGSVSYTPGKGKAVPVKFRIDNHPRIRCRVLHEMGYSATDIAEVLREEFGLGALETAQILADDDFLLFRQA